MPMRDVAMIPQKAGRLVRDSAGFGDLAELSSELVDLVA